MDSNTGRISRLRNKFSGIDIKLDQDFRFYIGWEGEQRKPGDRTMVGTHRRASGAYAFIPKTDDPPEPVSKEKVKVSVVKGEVVQEIHQEFSPWVSQVIRLYDGAPYLELEWTVGPIPVDDDKTKEVVSVFTSDIDSGGLFYTDSNGREMLERRRDFRSTWKLKVNSLISGNYYPVTSKIFIKDLHKSVQLTVLTDRCQGGSSIKDGQLELMVHRRTLKDDDLGVGEPLNEKGTDGKGLIIRGKHYVLLETIEKSPFLHRPLALEINAPPTVSFTKANSDRELQKFRSTWSGLRSSLPGNVHLLTLDQIQDGGNHIYLLRLENFYEMGEYYTDYAEVHLQRLFSGFDITRVEELSLGANFYVSEVTRLQWTGEDGNKTPDYVGSSDSTDFDKPPFVIRLEAMEIRTFRITVGQRTENSKSFWNIF